MAMLPDDTAVGAVDAESSELKPQADAHFEGAREKLATLIGFQNLKRDLDDASQLDDLAEIARRHQEGVTQTASSLFADRVRAERWTEARTVEARGLIDVATARLTQQQRTADADAWVEQLSQTALSSGGQDAAELIDAGMAFIGRAQGAGIYDQATAEARRQHWLQTHVEARIKQLPPAERIAVLGEPSPNAEVEDRAEPNGSDRLADVLTADTRTRLHWEARAELERDAILRSWSKATQYQQGMTEAVRGASEPAPSRAAIEADPDLDDLTRARLLQRHDAMQLKLDAFRSAKADYDNPNGRKFDGNDAKDREFADRIYTWLGADDPALHDVVNRTEILPEPALIRLQGDAASDDPARVMQAVDRASWLNRDHPKLLAFADDSEETQNVVAHFRHATARGATPDQAIQRIIQVHSPDYQAAWTTQRKNVDVKAEVAAAIGPADLARLPPTDPLVTAVAHAVYPELVEERFSAIGDVALARAQAREQLELLARAAEPDGSGDGFGAAGGGGEDPSSDLAGAASHRNARPPLRITVRPRWVVLPEARHSDGTGRIVEGREAAQRSADYSEALRAEPRSDELQELNPDSTSNAEQSDANSSASEPPVSQVRHSPELVVPRARVEQPAPVHPESKSDPPAISLEDREKFTAADAKFRGTMQGAAEHNQWATTTRWLEANPDATDEQLLAQFRPGLLRLGWAERRQAMVDYLRDAPRLLAEANENLKQYDAMPAARTAAELIVSARGQLYVAATSVETLFGGGSVKGATLLIRGLKTVLREAATAAITDAYTQWQNIEAGIQPKFDGVRTALSAGMAGLFGGVLSAGGDVFQQRIRGKAGHSVDAGASAEAGAPVKNSTPARKDAPVVDNPLHTPGAPIETVGPATRKLWSAEDAAGDLKHRVAKIEELAPMHPVSDKYTKAEVGKDGVERYADTFHAAHGKNLSGEVEVHHALEQQLLTRYPGLFSPEELNSLQNLRGIPKDRIGSALHRSIIRIEWNAFYNEYKVLGRPPTREEVLNYATRIDRKYGGLFDPPL